LLRWLVALLALGLTAKILVEDREALRGLAQCGLGPVAAVVGLFLVYLPIWAYRFLVITRAVGQVTIGYWEWFKLFTVSRLVNALFPQSGNVYQAVALKARHQLPYTRYVSAYVFFAWADSVLNLLLALVLILAMKPGLTLGRVNGAAAVGGALVVLAAGPLLAEWLLRRVRPGTGLPARVHRLVHGLLAAMVEQSRNPGLLAKVTALGLVLFALWLLLLKVCFEGVGVRPAWPDLALFLAVYKVTLFVVITPGNVGVLELLYGLLSECLGLGLAQGVLVAAVVRVGFYAVLVPLGVAFAVADLWARRKPAVPATPDQDGQVG
jgi:uncharacterized membrane protein YbhN (UPF0104 family)